ncbi:hypothetical protein AB1N83_013985 [Pleurotus pulmonarius]
MSLQTDPLICAQANDQIDLGQVSLTEADIPGQICVDEDSHVQPQQFSREYLRLLVRDPVNMLWAIILAQGVVIGVLMWYVMRYAVGLVQYDVGITML